MYHLDRLLLSLLYYTREINIQNEIYKYLYYINIAERQIIRNNILIFFLNIINDFFLPDHTEYAANMLDESHNKAVMGN